MNALFAAAVAVLINQQTTPRVQQLQFKEPDGGVTLYALSIPPDYDKSRPVPLVLALHPGGPRTPYYGRSFMLQIVAPALKELNAIMVAPDCPTNSWADERSERAVMGLLQTTMEGFAIDRRRVLVTGFSLGGRGTWFLSSRHADVFTAAIPMAGAPGNGPLDGFANIPTYVIHSRDDEVVPFGPAEQTARGLEKLGRPVRFEPLEGVGHFQMGGYVDALRRAARWVAERWAK